MKKSIEWKFTQEELDRLDRLKQDSEHQSRTDTIRTALRVYEHMVQQSKAGWTVQLVKGDDCQTLSMGFV